MQPSLCSRCGKNVAVIFITKLENGQTKSEGLCLKCAKELGLKPVEDIISRMGISDEDLENMNNEMLESLGGAENLKDLITSSGDDNANEDGAHNTATFPFLDKLFGAGGEGVPLSPPKRENNTNTEKAPRNGQQPPKKKFLEQFCSNLNAKAASGQIDNIVRKAAMNEVISGNKPNVEELHSMCKLEKLDPNSSTLRIGFGV